MKSQEKMVLTFDEIGRVARRFGGTYSSFYREWKFDNKRKKRRFERLVANGQTHEPLLHQIWYLFFNGIDAGAGWVFSVVFGAALLLLLPLWFWGFYQALMWGSFITPSGSGYWTDFHLYAAFLWVFMTGGFLLSRMGISLIIAAGFIAAAYVFLSPSTLTSVKEIGNGIQAVSHSHQLGNE